MKRLLKFWRSLLARLRGDRRDVRVISRELVEVLTVKREDNGDTLRLPDTWGLGAIWSASLLLRSERERKPRDYVWASELGKPLVDIWFSLRGVPYTNHPNARSLRKFEAGNVFEWAVKLILIRAGILVSQQERVEHQYAGMIKVTGKLDYIVGKHPDYEQGKAELDNLMLPEVFLRAGRAMIAYLEEMYPNGLEEKVVEVKSCSLFMFENYLKIKNGGKNHRMQTAHYIVGKNLRAAELFYLCRDDMRLLEVPILNPSPAVEEYKAEIARITNAMKSDTQPPIEKLIIFDEEAGKFSKNWGIEYSGYLTMLYGFERPDQYADSVKPVIARFNRVMGRVKRNDKITPKNLEALEEMKQWGFNPDELVAKFSGIDDEDEENYQS